MAGLRQFDAAPELPGPEPLPRVVVIVRRGWLIRLITTLTQLVHPDERIPRVR